MTGEAAGRPRGLSKSRITAFEQCPKKLWLSVHRAELVERDDSASARFATGNAVGDLACALHPNGVMVEAVPDLSAALTTTARLISEGHPGPIFEATFQHDGVLVRVDVLERRGADGWYAAEVKSSARVKDHHRGDLATQGWVLQGAGITLDGAAIRHVNTSFVLAREGDYDGLFVDVDLLDELGETIADRPALVEKARAVLDGHEPVRAMGKHCSMPFDCEFVSYCGRDLPPAPAWPMTLLPSGGGKRWIAKGIDDLLAVPEDALNDHHARILRATRDDLPFHDPAGARAAMAEWRWPRARLDFETVNSAIPRWVGTRPFQQIPFQFSLHLEHEDGTITHHPFLSCDGSDPRRACAEALVELVPPGASVVAWFASFEKRVLRELAAAFPNLADQLTNMMDATVDLLPVARNHWYHRDQRGSWSLKAVLPTIATELDYASLEIKDGGNAQEAWYEAADPACNPHRREALASALEVYCERDTWAMVVVAHKLAGTDR